MMTETEFCRPSSTERKLPVNTAINMTSKNHQGCRVEQGFCFMRQLSVMLIGIDYS